MTRVLLWALALSSSLAAADGYYCRNRIIFDCDHHMAFANGLMSPLDCGVSTPGGRSTHTGRIRRRGRANGGRWRCLKNKPMLDIGLGGVIIHTPCGNRMPKGQNQKFRHSGCLNISPQFFQAIQSCQGTSYEIRYATKGTWADGPVYAHRPQVDQWHYAEYGGVNTGI